MSPIRTLEFADWMPLISSAQTDALAADLEQGSVLYLPNLKFKLSKNEERFIDARWADPKAKNISYDGANGLLAGAVGEHEDQLALSAMIARYRQHVLQLVETLFPRYRAQLRIARTSLRLQRVEGRKTSWRKDDSRLHVDAFPSRPNQGERILRVFNNVNLQGTARVWRVGESFEDMASRFLPNISPQFPGEAFLLKTLYITKSRRTPYDHLMLKLHDQMKADEAYQREVKQVTMPFAAGSTWICFSDQASHAAMSGQFMLEQTLHLPITAQYVPARSPLKILERLKGEALI